MKPPALFTHRDRFFSRIDVIDIKPSDRRSSHTGLDESVDDGAVSIRSITFAPRPSLFPALMPVSILRLTADSQKQIRRIEHLPSLLRRDRPLDVERVPDGKRLNLCHRFTERKRIKFVHPLRERFQMSDDSIDGPIRVVPPPRAPRLLLKRIDKRT